MFHLIFTLLYLQITEVHRVCHCAFCAKDSWFLVAEANWYNLRYFNSGKVAIAKNYDDIDIERSTHQFETLIDCIPVVSFSILLHFPSLKHTAQIKSDM